jgi:hypothetical protein
MASVCLVCISNPAFAQRGGAGFHGGGGFRAGGPGFRGGFGGGFRGMPAPRSGGAFVRPGAPGGDRSYPYSGTRSMRPAPWNGAGRATVPWRSFRSRGLDGRGNTLARRGDSPGSAPSPSSAPRYGTDSGAWRSFSANRVSVPGSRPASDAAVPNALGMRNSISRAGALSAIRRAFGNPQAGNLRAGLNTSLPAGWRLRSPLSDRPAGVLSRPGTSLGDFSRSGLALNRFGLRDFNRFGTFDRFRFHPPFFGLPFRDFDFDDFFFFQNPFLFNGFFQNPFLFNNFFFRPPLFFNDFFFPSPFFGCFGCGFGFAGFNFGFAAPLWSGTAWPDAWFGGLSDPVGLPYGGILPYDSGLTYNSPVAGEPQSDKSSGHRASPRTPKNADNTSALLLLYRKNGAIYSVRDCWLADGTLHYTEEDGTEGILELDAIDFQRTVDENSKRGVPFTLKPNPNNPAPAR